MKRIAYLWALLLCACPPQPPKPPAPPPGAASCDDVCRHWAELGCEAAKPTADGVGCAEICRNVQDSTVVHWDLDCRVRAATCAAADSCESHR
jgi:hypothetical protein